MNEKLTELLKDEAVVKELFESETVEDAQKFFANKGVEVSVEELEKFRESVIASLEENDELGDYQLEQVAGGIHGIHVAGGIKHSGRRPSW